MATPRWAFKLFILVAACVARASSSSYHVSAIEFQGLQRIGSELAVTATEVRGGDEVDASTLQALADRVLRTGLFKSVQLRASGTERDTRLLFVVEEADWSVPVVFDNFLELPEQDLVAAVTRSVPGFAGAAPDSATMVAVIQSALQAATEAHGVSGRVRYVPDPRRRRHVFRLEGHDHLVCSVKISGSQAIPRIELGYATKPLLRRTWSRSMFEDFEADSLVPRYRDRARFGVRFGPPAVHSFEEDGCKGVEVTIQVEDGPAYVWSNARWTGNETFDATRLGALLGMKSGEPAYGTGIDAGLRRVSEEYQKQGFVNASVRGHPIFPQGGTALDYEIAVEEGVQYRMGRIAMEGFTEKDRRFVLDRFKLAEGAIYNAAYVQEFVREVLGDVRFMRMEASVDLAFRPDEARRAVDIQIRLRRP